jgi:hypothetical protein
MVRSGRRMWKLLKHSSSRSRLRPVPEAYIYPFLFNRCKFNIQRRIDKVCHIIESFLETIDVVLAEYQPQSLLEELPQFDAFRAAMPGTTLLSTTQVICKLFYTISKEWKRVELSNGNLETVTIRFSFLCAAAFTASKSRFLDSICADQNRLHNGGNSSRKNLNVVL